MQRMVKYDVLRITASFAIVLLHVSGSYWNAVDVRGREFVIMTIYNSLARFAIPVFFMLSGLFLASPARENVSAGRRVLKVIALFYIWSAFYAFQGAAIDALRGELAPEVWDAAVQRFLFGHFHMWFLQILAGFYLLIPIARQLCAKKEAVRYYLILWVVFRFLVPCLTSVFHLDIVAARIESLNLNILIGYFGYFLLGYYLDVTEIKRGIRWMIYVMGLVAACLTPLLTIRDSRASGTCVEKWFSPGSLNILVMSAAVFILFKQCKAFEKTKRVGLLGKISGYTFFVYMFHIFVIEKLNLIGVRTIAFPAIISIPLLTVFVFAVSLLGAFAADRIPIIRKVFLLH